MQLTFLGTRGEIEAQTRRHWRHSALLVSHAGARVLVDCGLDWLKRVDQIGAQAIVLTHAHPDHAFGLKAGAPCPVWASTACWRAIDRFPVERRKVIKARQSVSIAGIEFEAFPVEHSLLAPAVGYRISAGKLSVFYAPDLVYIRERAAALRGIAVYIGDGATLTRPLVRKRGKRLIGHAPISTQLTWCRKEGVARALITHCGTEIVSAPHAAMNERIRELGLARGVRAELAYDGLRIRPAAWSGVSAQ